MSEPQPKAEATPEPNPTSTDGPLTLSATYASPESKPFTLEKKCPAPASLTAASKKSYLLALRTATAELQTSVNRELTERMGEDRARDAAAAAAAIDEVKEEENYGEEVVEEDD